MEKNAEQMVQSETDGPRRYKHPEYPEEDTIPFFPTPTCALPFVRTRVRRQISRKADYIGKPGVVHLRLGENGLP